MKERPLFFPFLFFLVPFQPLKPDLQLTQWLQSKVSSIIVGLLLLMEHQARLEGTVIDAVHLAKSVSTKHAVALIS